MKGMQGITAKSEDFRVKPEVFRVSVFIPFIPFIPVNGFYVQGGVR